MLFEKVDSLIMQATKEHDDVAKEALRAFKAAVLNWKTAKENVGKDYDENVEIIILQKLVQQYKDTAEQCNDGKHFELVQNAKDFARYLSEYLPAPISEEDIVRVFLQVKDINNLESIMKNMGLFIKEIKKALPTADGKLISEVVKKQLS